MKQVEFSVRISEEHFRGSGNGGQNRNKHDDWLRMIAAIKALYEALYESDRKAGIGK